MRMSRTGARAGIINEPTAAEADIHSGLATGKRERGRGESSPVTRSR